MPKEKSDQYNNIYLIGGVTGVIAIIGTMFDAIFGSSLGMNLATETAVDRFAQFHSSSLLGLYNLDLLNALISIIMVPTFFAIYAAHRHANKAYAGLALIIYLLATAIFVTNNTALPMLDLSNKYYAATSESQKIALVAAGESMLARGAHGSPGVFLGFALTIISEFLISLVMLKGKVFSKATAYVGILGTISLFAYTVLVNFVPAAQSIAIIIVAPGGLLALAWMIMFTVRLFKLGKQTYSA